MSGQSLSGFQAALHALLSTDTALLALGVTIYDNVPSGAVMPYVAYGDAASNDQSSRTARLEEISLTCHAYSCGGGRASLLAILTRLDQMLSGQALISDTLSIPSVRLDKVNVTLQPDGITWHGALWLKALVTPLA